MAKVKLTARGVPALATDKPQEDFWDTVTPGLVLRVSSTGTRVWSVRYRVNGTRRRHKLGTFPHMSLGDARDAARDSIRRADAGEDPAQEREDRRTGRASFEALADEVLEARAGRTREKTQHERRRLLDKELLPTWGDREAASLTRREVVQLVEGIERRGAPVVANRTLALVRLLFNDGIRRGFPGIETNPAHLVEPPGNEDGRDRWLKKNEIKAVWTATGAERDPGTMGAFRLALLTAQRIGSVAALRWEDIDDQHVWRIPPANFKGKRPHLVPLSAEAREVVDELHRVRSDDTYVFPSRAGAKKPHVTNLSGSLARIRTESKLPHWTAHDFRTTFRTWAVRSPNDGGLDVPAHVADQVLGHKEPSLGFSRYQGDQDRYLLAEKRDALERWGALVRAAVEAES